MNRIERLAARARRPAARHGARQRAVPDRFPELERGAPGRPGGRGDALHGLPVRGRRAGGRRRDLPADAPLRDSPALAELLSGRRVAVEAPHLSLAVRRPRCAAGGVDIVSTTGLVEALRAVKDAGRARRAPPRGRDLRPRVRRARAGSRSSGGPRRSSPGGSSRPGTRPAPTGPRSTRSSHSARTARGRTPSYVTSRSPKGRSSSSTPAVRSTGTARTARGRSSRASRTAGCASSTTSASRHSSTGSPRSRPGALGRDVDAASRVAIEAAGHGRAVRPRARPRRRPRGPRGAEPAPGVRGRSRSWQRRHRRAGHLPRGRRRRPDRGHGGRSPTTGASASRPSRRSRCSSGRRGSRGRYPGAPAMADIVNTNQFRNGMHIEHRGSVWRIVEFQHVKPGKGGAFVRTKLKNLETGAVVDDTFRAGEKFARVHTEVKNVQFLYDDGSEAHFMDEETYEQFGLPRADIADELAYMPPVLDGADPAGERQAVRAPAARFRRARRRRDRAGRPRRHGVERDEARDARDGRRRPGAAVRQPGRADQGRPPRGALHLQGVRALLAPTEVGATGYGEER